MAVLNGKDRLHAFMIWIFSSIEFFNICRNVEKQPDHHYAARIFKVLVLQIFAMLYCKFQNIFANTLQYFLILRIFPILYCRFQKVLQYLSIQSFPVCIDCTMNRWSIDKLSLITVQHYML